MIRLMKRGLVLGLAVMATACQDLQTVNENEPDRDRALSSPASVESFIRGGFTSYYSLTESDAYPNWALSCGADEMSSSWGNQGMQQFCSEPRVAYPNDLVFTYRGLTESAWNASYRII